MLYNPPNECKQQPTMDGLLSVGQQQRVANRHRIQVTTACKNVDQDAQDTALSVEQPDDFEHYQQQQCEDNDQHEDAETSLPVTAVLQYISDSLGSCTKACVRDINIFIQLFKQSCVQVNLLPNSQRNMLQTRTSSRSQPTRAYPKSCLPTGNTGYCRIKSSLLPSLPCFQVTAAVQ